MHFKLVRILLLLMLLALLFAVSFFSWGEIEYKVILLCVAIFMFFRHKLLPLMAFLCGSLLGHIFSFNYLIATRIFLIWPSWEMELMYSLSIVVIIFILTCIMSFLKNWFMRTKQKFVKHDIIEFFIGIVVWLTVGTITSASVTDMQIVTNYYQFKFSNTAELIKYTADMRNPELAASSILYLALSGSMEGRNGVDFKVLSERSVQKNLPLEVKTAIEVASRLKQLHVTKETQDKWHNLSHQQKLTMFYDLRLSIKSNYGNSRTDPG